MNTKFLILSLVVGLAGTSVVSAQPPSPAESPTAAKHRTHKKKAASEAAAPETAGSPAATIEASPSPTEKHRRKAKASAAASPTVTPSPSPAKTLADFFKPKASPSAMSSAAPGTATSIGTKAAT